MTTMEMLLDFAEMLAVVWGVHLAIGGLLTAPVVYISRHVVQWRLMDLLVFVLPFALWAVLYMTPLAAGRGTLSNFVVEPFFLSIAIAVVAGLRVFASDRLSASALLKAELTLLCLVAVGLFFFVPPLPE